MSRLFSSGHLINFVTTPMGAEDFAQLLHDCDPGSAVAVAELLRVGLQCWRNLRSQDQVIPSRVSIGVICVTEPHDGLTQLPAQDDKRLHVAKRSGRNQVVGTGLLLGRQPVSGSIQVV